MPQLCSHSYFLTLRLLSQQKIETAMLVKRWNVEQLAIWPHRSASGWCLSGRICCSVLNPSRIGGSLCLNVQTGTVGFYNLYKLGWHRFTPLCRCCDSNIQHWIVQQIDSHFTQSASLPISVPVLICYSTLNPSIIGVPVFVCLWMFWPSLYIIPHRLHLDLICYII